MHAFRKNKIYKINEKIFIMNLNNIFLTTLIPELPRILRYNFKQIQDYFNLFYDASLGKITAPVNTSGRVKAATGEFVTTVTDDLIVKNQWTNIYENITTADKDYYNMYTGNPATVRDASVSAGENASYKYIDALAPYYKLRDDNPLVAFKTNTLGKIVEIIFDVPSTGSNFGIRLNNTEFIEIVSANSGMVRLELICIGIPNIDVSVFDNSWFVKKYSGNITISI